VLRNPEDSDTLRVAGLNTEEMLGGDGGTRIARKPTKSAPKASAPRPETQRITMARAPKPTVRIIREAKVTELPAPKDSTR
jgi:hypothetical protein